MPATAPAVLVVGEALVDVVTDSNGRLSDSRPGGSPLNVAVGLARLGVPTALLTTYGDDSHGDAVHRHLAGSGVEVVDGSRTAEPTSVARATLDRHGAARYEFQLQWRPPTIRLPASLQVLHVGSLGTALQPGAQTVRRMLTEACSAGVAITYDPNIRPSLSPAPQLAWPQVRDWAALADVVKLSDEDAAYLCPDAHIDDLIDVFLTAEVTRLVVVTRGNQPTRLATRRHRVYVQSAPVDVVDTVGAGDSYMSALIEVLLDQGVLGGSERVSIDEECLNEIGQWAAGASAITCLRRGADPPSRRELMEVISSSRSALGHPCYPWLGHQTIPPSPRPW